MNMALQAKEYQKLKNDLELINTFLESLEHVHKRDYEAYIIKKQKWLAEREMIIKKMQNLG